MISSKRVYQLMSILIALSLWIYVVAEQNIFQERVITVDVSYENLAETLTPSAKMPNVTLRIRGDQDQINTIRAADFGAMIDLSGAVAGGKEYDFEITLPDGIRVVSSSPSRIFVELEQKTEKQVPVRANVVGTTMEGFSSFEPVLKTTHVMVRGPKSEVDRIDFVMAEVNLDNANTNLSLKIAPDLKSMTSEFDEELLSIYPELIDIFVPIIEDNPSKSVPVRVVTTGVPSYGYTVSRLVSDPEIVRISGAVELIDSIQEIRTVPIDVSNLSQDLTREVNLMIPADVNLIYEDPIRATIIFERNVVEKRIEKNIEIRNAPEGFELQTNQPVISIVLKGQELDFRDFLADSLEVYVDAEAYSSGNREFTVQTSRPDKLEVIEISPSTVTLTRSNR